MMKNVYQHGYPLVFMFQNIADLLGKSQEYPGCYLGLRAIETRSWYLQGWTPWHLPLEIAEKLVELVEPTGTDW